MIEEAFGLAAPELRQALDASLMPLRTLWGDRLQTISLRLIDEESGASALEQWYETYRIVQWGEIWSCHGGWITETKPEFGPATAASLELTRTLDRRRIPSAIERRQRYFQRLMAFLDARDLLCIPTVHAPAPLKGRQPRRDEKSGGYYPRALSLTSLAGLGGLPQVTLPVAEVNGLPAGLSLLAGHGQDAFLLSVVQAAAASLVPGRNRSER
jgi:amidase